MVSKRSAVRIRVSAQGFNKEVVAVDFYVAIQLLGLALFCSLLGWLATTPPPPVRKNKK